MSTGQSVNPKQIEHETELLDKATGELTIIVDSLESRVYQIIEHKTPPLENPANKPVRPAGKLIYVISNAREIIREQVYRIEKILNDL